MTSLKRKLLSAMLAIVVVISWVATGEAQGVRGRRVVVRAPVFVGAYYSPYFLYDPWFGYDYQLYPWGPYAYPYRTYRFDPGAEMKLEVKPREAEVYLDGYYTGIVDDFDGAFQRLHARPGEHELTLYLDGFKTVHQRVMLTPNHTVKVKYSMEKLGSGEQPEPRPVAPPPPQPGQPMAMPMPGPQGQGQGPATRRAPQGPPPGAPMPPPMDQPGQPGPPMTRRAPRGGDANAYGSIAVRVQPGDAEVLIDGEAWRGPDGQDRLVVEVADGRHTVEIRKPGYRSYVTDVQVRRGETTNVNVSLRTQEEQ